MRRLHRLAMATTLLIACAGESRAIDLLTGDGYLLALAQDEAARSAADNYLGGTLDTLIVVNEVTASGEDRLFCLSDERASLLDGVLLRQEFTDWLRDPPTITQGGQDPNSLPLAVLGWAFLVGKFPCAAAAHNPVGDETKSRLLDSLPDR